MADVHGSEASLLATIKVIFGILLRHVRQHGATSHIATRSPRRFRPGGTLVKFGFAAPPDFRPPATDRRGLAWRSGHPASGRETRKQHVVLQMDVLHHLLAQAARPDIQRPPSRAGLFERLEAVRHPLQRA